MTLRMTLAVGAAALGAAFALGVTAPSADVPRVPAAAPQTVTVPATLHGHSIRYYAWRSRQHLAQRDAARKKAAFYNTRFITAQRKRALVYRPTVRYAIALARAVYGVDQTRRTYCESRDDPGAVEGHGPVGLLQFFPSTWATTPFARFSIWDPVAQELAGGWMVRAGRSGEWACGL